MRKKTTLGAMLALVLVVIPSASFPGAAAADVFSPTSRSFLGRSKSNCDSILKPDSLQAVSPPTEGWILLATDADEETGANLKAIYGQVHSSVIYFKVEYYRPWTNVSADIDTGILVDADQNMSTGLPDGHYSGQNTGIGADYLIVVGWEGKSMWWFDPTAGFWNLNNTISLAYLDAPDNASAFIVGVYLADIRSTGALDCAAADVPSGWDWIPDTGHFTIMLEPTWNYVFEDSYGRGTMLKINTAEKVFQFTTPSRDYGVRTATFMLAFGRAVAIDHEDSELRLVTLGMDKRLDFCSAKAWDVQQQQQYVLLDKPGSG